MNRLRALVCTLLAALPLSLSALIWTDDKGIVWSYTVSNGEATITDIPTDTAGAVTIPARLPNGNTTCPVTVIGASAFFWCSSLTSVTIPEGVTSIGDYAFCDCTSLTSVVIPEGVTSIGKHIFRHCYALTSLVIPKSVTQIGDDIFWNLGSSSARITFFGDVPNGWENIVPKAKSVVFPQEYGGHWISILSLYQRETMIECIALADVSVTAEMTTPKTMRVTYKITQAKGATAKVRAVAWKDGVRSFANIVPVKTTAAGSPEEVPNGGEVTTGVEHTFVWQVSSDWSTDLDKVALEILVEEGNILPQEIVTIPAVAGHAKMTITRNRIDTYSLFNALLWCYAEGDSALTVSNGIVKVNGTQVASGNGLAGNNTALLNYLYGKMGFKVLAGADLTYAREAMEIEFADSGLNQVSVKISEE